MGVRPESGNGTGCDVDLLVLETLAGDDVLFALGCVEVDGQLDALRLVHSQGQVALLLQVLQPEALKVLFGERLCIQQARRGRLFPRRADPCRPVQTLVSGLLAVWQ